MSEDIFDDLFNDDDDEDGFDNLLGDEEENGFDDSDYDNDSDYDDGDFDDLDDDFDVDELDDLNGGDLDDDDFADMPESGGLSRTAMLLFVGMMLISIVGIGAVLLLALTKDSGPSPFEQTSTAIAIENAGTLAAFEATQTQQPIDQTTTADAELVAEMFATQAAFETAAFETATAEYAMTVAAAYAMTATAEAMVTEVVEGTTTPYDAGDILATQNAQMTMDVEATTAAGAGGDVETPTREVQTPVGASDVALTATAITAALQTPISVGTPTETPIGGPDGQVVVSPTPRPVVVPHTGLFDDITGGTGFGMIALVAFGLVGLVFGARTLRLTHRKQ